jgi:hypothetical protein
MDSRVKDILSKQSQMESARVNFESHWKEVAERILPRQDDFMGNNRTEGAKRTEKIFDSTGVLALDRSASAVESLIVPSSQTYHRLDPDDTDLMEDHEVRLWLDDLNKVIFRMRYRPQANFASQAHECLVSLMAFGTDGMFVDEIPGSGSRYKSCPVVEMFIAENQYGVVDYVHRKFPFTVRAAMQKWGNKLPEAITKIADKEPFRKFDFIHCVGPNMERDTRRKDFRGMAMSSYYISVEGGMMLDAGGYRVMPYAVGRHVTAPREVYGRSPAMQVLPDIKMVNEMEKTILRAAQKIVSPPLLIYGDGILRSFDARPDALNYGGVDDQGRQMVVPMKTGSNLPIGLELAEQKRKVINDAFYITLFQILVENPRMTATEAMIRAQEKGQLLAPTIGRQESEWLGNIVESDIDIIMSNGMIRPPPPSLVDAGGGIKVVHTSPLSRLRRAEDGVAIMRTLEQLAPMAQLKPEILDSFDDDAIVREISDINGVPAKIMRPIEIVAQIREERKQAQQAQSEMAMAEQGANAARNAAKAADTAGLLEESPQ